MMGLLFHAPNEKAPSCLTPRKKQPPKEDEKGLDRPCHQRRMLNDDKLDQHCPILAQPQTTMWTLLRHQVPVKVSLDQQCRQGFNKNRKVKAVRNRVRGKNPYRLASRNVSLDRQCHQGFKAVKTMSNRVRAKTPCHRAPRNVPLDRQCYQDFKAGWARSRGENLKRVPTNNAKCNALVISSV